MNIEPHILFWTTNIQLNNLNTFEKGFDSTYYMNAYACVTSAQSGMQGRNRHGKVFINVERDLGSFLFINRSTTNKYEKLLFTDIGRNIGRCGEGYGKAT